MSTTFSRCVHALDTGSLRTSILGLSLALALLALWGAWFLFARVTLYEVSETVCLVTDRRAVAHFPPTALTHIRPGQRGRLHLADFPSAQYGTVSTTVSTVTSRIGDGHVEVVLTLHPDPAHPIPLQQGLTGIAEIEIGHVSPAALVLQSATKRPAAPVDPESSGNRRMDQ